MIKKKKWEEFKEAGLLWWINQLLHTFGWAIVFKYDEAGELASVYPARVKFRGFNEKVNTEGYINISKYMRNNCEELLMEAEE